MLLLAALAPGGTARGQSDTTCAQVIAVYDSAHAHLSATSLDIARSRMLTCVNRADSSLRFRILSKAMIEAQRLGGVYTEIPEYHDEGRLPAGNDASGQPILGPMAQIFASPTLGTFTRRTQIAEHGYPGFLAAYVVITLDANQTTVPASYARLHLEPGINCVWLHLPDAEASTNYKAYVSRASDRDECTRNTTLHEVSVARTRDSNFPQFSQYPAAARFDVDRNGDIVLGVKCLDAFCEVGTTSAMVRRPTGLPGNTVGLKSQRVIKGWHDEQLLAIRDANNIWRPSNVRATIVPERGIDELDSADFHQRWRHVATIMIHGALTSGKYFDWGLASGKNEVWLQYNGAQWVVEIRRPNGSVKSWTNVKRMIHLDAAVPGTARFRWTAADDGIWVPCGNACCQADGT